MLPVLMGLGVLTCAVFACVWRDVHRTCER